MRFILCALRRNNFTNHRDYFKINGHFLKSYCYKAEAWLLSSACFIAAKFLHFGNYAVYSSSWSGSKSKAWNHCEHWLTVFLSLIDGLYCHFVEHSDVNSSSFGMWGWFFIFKDAQKWSLRSPVAFITSGTIELKAAPLRDSETLSSVMYYLTFFFLIMNIYEGKHMLQNKSM